MGGEGPRAVGLRGETVGTHATGVLSALLPYLHTWQVLGCLMY